MTTSTSSASPGCANSLCENFSAQLNLLEQRLAALEQSQLVVLSSLSAAADSLSTADKSLAAISASLAAKADRAEFVRLQKEVAAFHEVHSQIADHLQALRSSEHRFTR